jgi:hypothetical protein
MRQPSFLAFTPLLLLYVAETYKTASVRNWIRSSARIFLPVLIFLPILVSGVVHGTPSTEPLGNGFMVARVLSAIQSGAIGKAVSSSISFLWLMLLTFVIFPLSTTMKTKNIGLLAFSCVAVIVYYSIHPSLWGSPKYQAEYAAPLVIAGLLLLMLWLNTFKFGRYFLYFSISILLISNVWGLRDLPYLDLLLRIKPLSDVDSLSSTRRVNKLSAAVPYEYKGAYTLIKESELEGSTYSIGATYGVLPEIINGFNLIETRASYNIYAEQEINRLGAEKNGVSVDMIVRDARIKAVMVGPIVGRQKLVENFLAEGWVVIGEFKNNQYGTIVHVIRRPQSNPALL